MEYGPVSYVPAVQVELIRVVRQSPLDKNEGVYVRDTRSGLVRAVIGETYMLKPHEELFEMELSEGVERLLAPEREKKGPRDKTKVVTYRCPYNSAVQIYDYKRKENRIEFGPGLVMLQPDEVITENSLSGGKPKVPNKIKTLSLVLGPDFSTDICDVETSDHGKLRLQLSYNWEFRVDKNNKEEAQKIFMIKDFVGDLCNIMASKVRAAVAGVSFDDFHKNSARLIRVSVFGVDEQGKIRDELFFPKNNLCVTNVDIQLVEPVNEKTKTSLKETVSMAIEITTKMQEEEAKRQSDKAEQENSGQLNKIIIDDKAKAEEARKKLIESQLECERIKQIGEANALANAQSQAEMYEAEMKLKMAKQRAEAKKLQTEATVAKESEKRKVEIEYDMKMTELNIRTKKMLAEIESKKFQDMIKVIGTENMVEIANAGPETQAKLLEGLGLKGYLMTNGNNTVNLFGAAQGLIGGMTK